MDVKESILERVLKRKIEEANKKLPGILAEKHTNVVFRKFAIRLTDTESQLGFGFDPENKCLVWLTESYGADATMYTSSRVLKALLVQKTTPDKVFYGNFARFDGNTLLKDKILLTEMLYAMGEF